MWYFTLYYISNRHSTELLCTHTWTTCTYIVAFFVGSVRGYDKTQRDSFGTTGYKIYTHSRIYRCSRQDQPLTFTVHKLANTMEHHTLCAIHSTTGTICIVLNIVWNNIMPHIHLMIYMNMYTMYSIHVHVHNYYISSSLHVQNQERIKRRGHATP